MSVDGAFCLLAFFTVLAAAFGVYRYGTFLNPLSIFCTADIGVFTFGSGIVALSGPTFFHYTGSDVAATALLSLVFLLGYTTPYLFREQASVQLFSRGLSLLRLNSVTIATRFSRLKLGLLLLGFVLSFAGLALSSGGGLLWILNPRLAYQTTRTGVGPFEMAADWCLVLALMYYLWSCRPRGIRLLLVTACFCVPMSFLGSKNNILTLGVIALVYQNFQVKRIPGALLAVFGLGSIISVLGLIVLQGSYASLYEALFYFRDYFDTSAAFISRFNEFGFQYGRAWLSSFWYYVPRGLYPDKPYEYGALLINKVLFPGAAEVGGTPGSLTWNLSYLDFGPVGVFFDGLTFGLWRRMAYENYSQNPRSFFSFLLMIHLSLWPVLVFAGLPYLVLLMISFSLYLRLSVRVPSVEKSLPQQIAVE